MGMFEDAASGENKDVGALHDATIIIIAVIMITAGDAAVPTTRLHSISSIFIPQHNIEGLSLNGEIDMVWWEMSGRMLSRTSSHRVVLTDYCQVVEQSATVERSINIALSTT